LFPIRREMVNRIDMKAGKIEVSLPAGLLEL
jgi:ribosomal 30S subunit maturation factor RimM